jgi:hypothetical protein
MIFAYSGKVSRVGPSFQADRKIQAFLSNFGVKLAHHVFASLNGNKRCPAFFPKALARPQEVTLALSTTPKTVE